MQKCVNTGYYGFHDEDDGILVGMELAREAEILRENAGRHKIDDSEIDNYVKQRFESYKNEPLLKAVNVPDQSSVQEALLQLHRDKLSLELDENFIESQQE